MQPRAMLDASAPSSSNSSSSGSAGSSSQPSSLPDSKSAHARPGLQINLPRPGAAFVGIGIGGTCYVSGCSGGSGEDELALRGPGSACSRECGAHVSGRASATHAPAPLLLAAALCHAVLAKLLLQPEMLPDADAHSTVLTRR